MTQQVPPIDVGSSVTDPATEDESYFDRYVEDKSKKPPSFIDRAYDTAKAAYYSGTIFGVGEATEQAGFSTLYPEQFPERFNYDLKLIEAAKDSTAPAPMTPAQTAQVRNRAYPEATTAAEKAADILGGLVGGSASPETVLLPGVKGLSALKATSALGSTVGVIERYLPGMAYRAVDTGLGQAALMATVDPVLQSGRVSAGLQREFDPWQLTASTAGGFIFGAGLHLGIEGGGRLAGKAAQSFADSPVGQSMMQGFERRFAETAMQRIKEQEPGFRSPMDIVETPAVVGEPAFDARVEAGQPSVDAVGSAAPINEFIYRGQPAEYPTLQSVDNSNSIDNILIGKGVFTTSDEAIARSYGPNIFRFNKPTEGIFDISNAAESDLRRIMPDTFFEKVRYSSNLPERSTFDTYQAAIDTGNIKEAEDVLIEALANKYLPDDITWDEVKSGLTVDQDVFVDDIREKMSLDLQSAGFDFVKHQGGIRAGGGNGKHDVFIALNDSALKQADEIIGSVETALAEPTPGLPPPAQNDVARQAIYYDDLGEPMYALTPDTPMPSEDAAALAKMIGRTYAPARPQTLLGFIRGLGGVKDSGGDLRSQNINRRFPGLMNEKTGLPLDRAREAAVEQGYLPEDSTPDDLVQLLLSDEPVYSKRDAGQAEEYNRYQEALRVSREYKQAAEIIEEKYPTTHPKIIDDAAMRMAYDNLDMLEAIEAAAESVTIERSPEFEPDDNLTEIFDAWAVQRSPKTNANAKGQGSPPAEPGRRSSEVGAGNTGTGSEGTRGFSFEAGAEGKAQAVVPGAERISDRALAERRANQPMRGGNEPAGGMFDEINTAQGDFLAGPVEDRGMQFRRRGPVYPPEEAARVAEAQDGIIRSLQQQSFDLAAKIGIPLREGRVRGGRYSLGQFEAKFGVARVSQIGDFLTVAHEAGHAIEQRIGSDLTDLMNNHVLELAKLDPSGDGRVSEGFAEWVAKYIMNPAAAMKDAPTFTSRFTEFMRQRDPEIMDAIIQASNNYNALLTAPTPIQLGASISSIEPQGWFRDLVRSYRENGMSATIGRVLADAYTATIDAYDPLTRATRDMTRLIYKANGKQLVDLKASERPDILMRMNFARSSQGAAFQLRYGVVPYRGTIPDGPSLHDAISVATGQPGLLGKWDSAKVDEFGLFLAIKRAEILIERYNAGDFGERYPLPENWTKANVENAKAAILAESPQYEEAAQMVHDFTQQLLKKQFDGGIIDRELYDKLSQTPFYVPMFRDVSDKPLAAGRPGGSPDGPGMTDTIRTLRGSSRDIINPLQGIMQQSFLIERTLRHNDVIRSFVDLASRAGAPSGFLVEPVPAREVRAMSFDLKDAVGRAAKESGIPDYDAELLMSSINNIFGEDPLLGSMFKNAPTKKRGEPIVFYKEAGELKAVRLMAGSEGRAVYEAMMTLPTAGKDIAVQVMQAAGNIQRAGIVLEPTFMISNLIRDQLAISILRPDYIPGWDGAKGVWSEITQDEAARLYGYFGGQSAGGAVNEAVGMAVEFGIDDLGRKNILQQRLKSPLAFAEITQISEAGARNSIFAKVYEQKLAAGLAPYEAAMEAAWAGTDILDFSRHGSKTFIIRQLTPFWNANIQALDKARRTMLAPLEKAMRGDVLTIQEKQEVANAKLAIFKLAAVGTALGAIWAAINNDDEVYRDADPKRKATHFIFSLGGKEIDTPKPFELSLGFTFGEQAFAALNNKDPRAAQNFVTAMWETLIPPSPVAGNPLIKMMYEGATGVDTYTGRDIVPENMQKFNETPDLQYNERTAPLAIGISQTSKVLADYMNSATGETFGKVKPFSPIVVEHMFGSGFGTIGRDMMAASHWFNPSSDSAPAQFEDTVFLRRYIKDPTRTSDTITRYYQHAAGKTGDYVTAASSYDELIKNRRPADARQLYNGLKADQKAYVLLASAGTDEGKAAFNAKDRRIHPMKRAQDALQQLHEVARQIGNNTQSNSETGASFALSRSQRKSAIEAIHQLGAQEMRNALVMTNEPGYEARNILDVNKQYAVIKAISPDLAEEVARRYAMAGVYKTELVAKNWPTARKELLRAGSNADISDITSSVDFEGFEFGAEKISRPRKRRLPMEGQPAAQ